MRLLHSLLISLWLISPLAAAQEPPASERAARVEAMLSEVSAWLNTAWAAQYPGEPFLAQPLSMGNSAFLGFARARFSPQDQPRVGSHALSAFYEPRGFVNGQPTPICYLLFNSENLSQLEEQFYLLPDADSQMAATLFLVAHEAGHCLDQRQKTLDGAPSSQARGLWGEYGADIFAGLAVLEVTGNRALMEKIAQRRRHGGLTHSTEPGLRELLERSKINSLPKGLFIKDLWGLADNIRKKSFH